MSRFISVLLVLVALLLPLTAAAAGNVPAAATKIARQLDEQLMMRYAGTDPQVSKKEQQAVAAYGSAFGAAFQIMDDVLDETGDPAILGKPVGSDAANEKTTFVSLLGLEESRGTARREIERAIAALPDAGSQTAFLHALARYVVDRNS